MTVLHPRFDSQNEVLRWVHGLEMTSDGIFKQVVSVSGLGVMTHRKERFLTWTQCASDEPINLAIGTLGWRREGADMRFDLSSSRLACVQELATLAQGAALQNAPGNPFIALPIDARTTLLIDTITFIERVLLQSQHAFELATSPFRDLFVQCLTQDDCTSLRHGPLAFKSCVDSVLLRGAANGRLPRLITWLESDMWTRYFGALLWAVRKGIPPPLPAFEVTGWLRFDGMRIGNIVIVEYLCGIVEQIKRPRRISYMRAPAPLCWRIGDSFPKRAYGDIDFDAPYDYEPDGPS